MTRTKIIPLVLYYFTDGCNQGSADSPYNTEIVLISPNEGKLLRKDFEI